MYSVLIADDEPAVCKGLQVLIPWEDYGFRVEGCAYSGIEALQIMGSQRIDLLITDIKMPGMDGLRLIKAIKETGHNTKIVIISAYRDFDYAKRAMKYGVRDFVTKPIDESSIMDMLVDIKSEITAEREKIGHMENSRKLMLEQLFRDMVKGGNDLSKISDEIARHGICLQGGFMYVSLVHVNLDSDNSGEFLIKKLNSILGNYCKGYAFKDDKKRICIVSEYNHSNLTVKNKVEQEIYYEVNSCFPGKAIIAIGNNAKTVFKIDTSYNNASKALQWALLNEKCGLVHYQDINFNRTPDYGFISRKIEEFKRAMACGENKRAEELIREVMSHMLDQSYPVEMIYNRAVRILIYMDDLLREPEIREMKAIDKYSGDSVQKLSGKELQDYLASVCQSIDGFFTPVKKQGGNTIIDKVADYTMSNSHKDLSLKMLSEIFHINHVYLGRLFYESTGMHFSDFQNDCRVKNAAILLKNTDMKIYEIAHKVGYSDIDYFTKVFKDRMDISPVKYRNSIRV